MSDCSVQCAIRTGKHKVTVRGSNSCTQTPCVSWLCKSSRSEFTVVCWLHSKAQVSNRLFCHLSGVCLCWWKNACGLTWSGWVGLPHCRHLRNHREEHGKAHMYRSMHACTGACTHVGQRVCKCVGMGCRWVQVGGAASGCGWVGLQVGAGGWGCKWVRVGGAVSGCRWVGLQVGKVHNKHGFLQ